MSSIRCPQCGLVNWATSAECKRCALPLDARAQPSSAPYGATPPPPGHAVRGGGPAPMFGAQYVCPVCRRPSLADFCRHCQPAASAFDEPPAEPQYKSIGGWLILPAIGLVLSPLLLTFQIFRQLSLFGTERWEALTTPGTPHYIDGLSGYATFEMVTNGLLLVFCLYVAYNFFTKKKATPRLMVVFLVASVAVLILDAAYTGALLGDRAAENAFEGVGRRIVPKAAWLLYFLRSKRVKGTFVN